MRLTAKFGLSLFLAIVVILCFDGVARVRRATGLFDQDMPRDAQTMGRAMRPWVQEAWRRHGAEYALRLIEEADHKEDLITIRWVWLDATPGDPHGLHAGAEHAGRIVGLEPCSFKAVGADAEEYLYTCIPVKVESPRRGALELREPLFPVREFVRGTVLRELALTGTIALTSGVAVSALGVVLVGRPLRRLIDKTRRIGSGDLCGPVDLRSRDELAELGDALNRMCEELAAAHEAARVETEARLGAMEQLRHADRLATVGRLAAGVAHELGTPLNVVLGRAGMIARGSLAPDEAAACAEIIRGQADRMTATIRQLLSFARPRRPEKLLADLHQLARQTLELMRPLARKKQVKLTAVGDGSGATARVDLAQMQQVLTNLIDNAIYAVGERGEVEVGVQAERVTPPPGVGAEEGEYVCLSVRDDGGGIAEGDLPHVFDPFFTTKDVGEGTGLGLSIAYGIVHEHGGWIGVDSRQGAGSCFRIYLPKGE